jgi:small multidrug resistance pump
MSRLVLMLAILSEVFATTALKASDGFTRPWPILGVAVGYGIAFWLLAIALKTIPVGVAYAIWSGVGIVAIAIIGYFAYGQTLDRASIVGIGLIIAGVTVMNVFSKAVAH